MLVHEVAHEAYYAACGTNSYELPFEFNTVSETGYDWEAFGFGGIIGHGHTVIDWPSPSRCKEYTKNGWSIWLQDDPPDVEFEAHWIIPLQYVQKLYTNAFWEITVPLQGAESLKIPRIRGQLFVMRPDQGLMVCDNFEEAESCSYQLPENVEYRTWGEIEAIAPGFEWEGFGRLMKIDGSWLFAE